MKRQSSIGKSWKQKDKAAAEIKQQQLEKLEKSKKNEAAIKKILDQKKSKADALENSKEAVEREARTKFGMGKENETVLRYEK